MNSSWRVSELVMNKKRVSYRNCLICGNALLGKTVKETQRLQSAGWCGCSGSKEERAARARRAGKGTGVKNIPTRKDEKLASRIEMVVKAAEERGSCGDRDVVLVDVLVPRMHSARKVG